MKRFSCIYSFSIENSTNYPVTSYLEFGHGVLLTKIKILALWFMRV